MIHMYHLATLLKKCILKTNICTYAHMISMATKDICRAFKHSSHKKIQHTFQKHKSEKWSPEIQSYSSCCIHDSDSSRIQAGGRKCYATETTAQILSKCLYCSAVSGGNSFLEQRLSTASSYVNRTS